MSDLRSDLEILAPEVDVTGAWERVEAGVPRRRRQMAMRRVGVTFLAAGAVIVVGWIAMPGQESAPVVDTATPTTSTPPPSTVPLGGAPSQSLEDAARDGVVSELAEAPYESRVDPLLTVESAEGTWILSELTDDLLDSSVVEQGCRIGDPQGDPPAVCAHEYGEVLLVRDDAIVRAFPFPGVPPSWLHVGDDAVYAGRIGDGALPHSTVVRIERATLESSTVVFVHPDAASAPQILPGWREATAAELEDLPDLVGFASAGMEGTDVESWVGDVRVDLEGVRGLFSESAGSGSDDLIRLDEVARCGLRCFDVTYSGPTVDTDAADFVPPQLDYEDPRTLRFDCSVEPEEVVVVPAEGLDPAWDGDRTGCEAVLALGRWASVSPYFELDRTDGHPTRFHQIDGSWVEAGPENPGCFGASTDPPACDLAHAAADWFYMTIEDVAFTGEAVEVTGTEWDIAYIDAEFDVGGPTGPRSINLDCSAGVEAPSEQGEGWTRILDACLLADLFESGEDFPGAYEVVLEPGGEIRGLAHRPEISLP